jgi:hypothetical protein
MDYEAFIRAKRASVPQLGFPPPPAPEVLFPFQRDIFRWLLTMGRAGLFASFGLGKTLVQLAVGRAVCEHTGGRFIIVAPLGVRQEFARDAKLLGVDLATGETEKKRKTDLTVLFDLGVHVDTGRRRVLWIEKGRYTGPHTVRRLGEHKIRYSPRRVLVESNAQQKFLLQFLAEVPGWDTIVEPFHTDGTKWSESLGIEGIAGEMMAGRWQIPGPRYGANVDDYVRALTNPSDADKQVEAAYLASLTAEERAAYEAIREWVSHLFDFQRTGHTADDVMASWFARVGAMKLAAGVFVHTKAEQMSPPPPELVSQQTHGNAPTTAGIFEEMPAHIRAQLGL